MRKWLCVDRVAGIEQVSAIVWAETGSEALEISCDRRNLVVRDDPMSLHEFREWYKVVDVTDLEDEKKPAWRFNEIVELRRYE